jgi:fermentation-respiration switch protein FrsA (DUF1100 family)
MLNLLLSLAGIGALICVVSRLLHRYFIYLPDRTRYAPGAMGLPDVEEISLETQDGVRLIAWYSPARGTKPTLLYFTGVGGCAGTRAEKIRRLRASGYGVFMLNYRRYGGSGGRPSEKKNVADAALAYDWLWTHGLKPSDIVAYGESIGSGVATQLARLRPVKALVMEATFTSIVDVGRQVWWCLPLNLIMVDQYRNLEHIKGVKVPLLIMHGARDNMIPVHQARHLYAVANEPKKLAILPRGEHSNLYDCGAVERMRDFLDGLDAKALPRKVRHPEPAEVAEAAEVAA